MKLRLPVIHLLISLTPAVLSALDASPALREAAKPHFLIGAAVNHATVHGDDATAARIAAHHFNTITPENALKWKALERTAGTYDFQAADAFLAFAEQHAMKPIGHTLLWHESTPAWILEEPDGAPVSREVALDRLRRHVHTVVGRYRGRILGWDVVNEAFLSDGSLRDHAWYRIAGEAALVEAYRAAHEADPDAELYYNDYGLWDDAKRSRVIALVRDLRARGLRIDGVGLQEHITLEGPTLARMRAALADFAAAGIPVMITELDISVLPRPRELLHADVSHRIASDPALNPYRDGLPDEIQQRLARRYADVFALYLEFPGHVRRVTFWGVTDRSTWLNNWPVRGRRDHPLLFDANGLEKPAFQAVLETLRPSRDHQTRSPHGELPAGPR